MAITPNTNIRLLKVPFEIDNKNQLTFSSKQAQTNYFLGLPAIEIDKAQYQRKNNVMYFPAHIDSIMEYNYVMYQNDNYSDKWFYAFITNKAYNNDGLTDLTLKTDVFQTWQFDIIYKRSFIEREHVNDDTIGKNIIEENLNVPEYVVNESSSLSELNKNNCCVVMGVTSSATGQPEIHGGVFSGLSYVGYNNNSSGREALRAAINNYVSQGKGDEIYTMFEFPKSLCGFSDSSVAAAIPSSESPYTLYKNTSINSSIDGYTPKNKKLLTYPFNYLLVSNNNGSNNVYKYEKFNNINNINFQIKGVITVGGSIRLFPLNYSGLEFNQLEGIDCGKFPTCSWSTDSFTNWITQNAVNIGVNAVGAIGNAIIGNEIGAVSNTASLLSQFYQASIIPDVAKGNINNGDVNYTLNLTNFTFNKMSIKKDYAIIYDDFFSMYGYKINDVKTPNITGRRNWNYVKTVDCNLLGEIPQEDLEELKQIFNNGVTFWHNPSTFLDYSQNNNIV